MIQNDVPHSKPAQKNVSAATESTAASNNNNERQTRADKPTRTQSLIEETKEDLNMLSRRLSPQNAYGQSSSIPPPRRNLQNGAYRMVFTDKKSQSSNHNRLNLRDKSTDPGNLYGDANINASRAQQRGSRGGVRM